ncbi:MAG: PRC-barrel domain-containing protein [Coriobacteriia bacterium]|nr:PRC-barrel domain-containing protein [Coriobacteriia bacterium]
MEVPEALQGTLSTASLMGKKVFGENKKGKAHKIGKIHNFVFHPTEKRLIGVLVKRPDAAMMFHRKDAFVRLGAWEECDEGLLVSNESDAMDAAACKSLGVDWNSCVLWWGLPVVCDDGDALGTVGDVWFDPADGKVAAFELEGGMSESVLLGTVHVPSDLIRGFKLGVGSPLVQQKSRSSVEDASELGAVLVSSQVKELSTEGGLAEKAGTATGEAVKKVRRTVVRVKPKVQDAAEAAKVKAEDAMGVSFDQAREAAKPKIQEAKETAGAAAEKGLFAAGRQLGRASTMFSSFKEEYERARDGE